MHKQSLIYFFFFFYTEIQAGGIKGIITDTKGERLPFTSVIVKGLNSGTMANADGEYLINLKPGNYDINFQFLGYKTLTRHIVIGQDFVEMNIKMEEQTITLKEVNISSKEEDPAYTIMRKAIAKSKIHQKQVVNYQAKAYVKNSILLNKIPLVLRKDLNKQNIKEGVPFLSESVMEISYTEPNAKYTKIFGQKSTFDGISISDGFYLFDFYDPGNNRISPLSPLAFKYYKFEYEGFFEDRGLIVNKIKIIPKSYGDGVWQGTIHIIDDFWNIHSIDVETIDNGLNLKLSQYYGPIEKVWLPINQRLDFSGKLFGFDFLIKAQVNANYSAIKTNPTFVEEIKLIDETKEGKIQELLTRKTLKNSKTEELLKDQKEFSIKNLKRIMKDFEKEERVRAKEKNEDFGVISNEIIEIDPKAKNRDSTYWNSVRNIPLTAEEKESYEFGDSIKVAQVLKRDSLKRDSIRKSWQYFIMNYDFKLKNGRYLHFEPPYMPLVGLNYNSVEGIVADLGLGYKNYTFFSPRVRFKYNVYGNIRYAFEEKKVRGKLGFEFEKGPSKITFGIGKYIAQFDPNSFIFEWMNSVTTLLNEQNFLKIYDKKYINLAYTYERDPRLSLTTNLEVAERFPLENLSKIYTIKDFEKNGFSINNPPSIELGSGAFSKHTAFIWQGQVKWTPSSKIAIRNGIRKILIGKAPAITLTYKKGMIDTDFDYLSLNIKQNISLGQLGKLDYMFEVGDFLNDRKVYLMDMKHINNNYLNALQTGLFARYRLLDTRVPVEKEENISYINQYKFSTSGPYLQGHIINEFKKLLFTQASFVRIWGLKEDIFVNYLNSPSLKNYVEIGYGIDGILKALRIEAVTSYENGKYQRWGVKLGVTM
ncbi:DUF5686 and carboxypeptidase regulatory-like domain-containing protein [Emticicia sp. BO119]|uniref:DUF5686 and carboxypeptidase regulatory-like domain-containing protein n=1 Tax=Emticicia sp. BO119 TaxID=2757768 RepID=UPI0015F0CF47|nr:DUF5686 and carboxypeptidase regulatory-like domain-containing protein [Emticicia sp. BO119]MBA4853570.1 carboxypeptidase-like regulatory domain-containing protein [Emticicia sp. BO119]